MLDEAYEQILRRTNYVTLSCSGYSRSGTFLVCETLYNVQTDRAASCIKYKVKHCDHVSKYLIIRRRCISYTYSLTSTTILFKQIPRLEVRKVAVQSNLGREFYVGCMLTWQPNAG
jgi:hypothetical protein